MKKIAKLLAITLVPLLSNIIYSHNINSFELPFQDVDNNCVDLYPNNPNAWEECIVFENPTIGGSILDSLPTFRISLRIDDSGPAVSSGDYIFCEIEIDGEFAYSSQHYLTQKKINQYLNHFTVGSDFFAGKYKFSGGLKTDLKGASDGESIEIDCPSSIELPNLLVNTQGAVYEVNNKSYPSYTNSDLNVGHNYNSHVMIYEKGSGPVISQPIPQPSPQPEGNCPEGTYWDSAMNGCNVVINIDIGGMF